MKRKINDFAKDFEILFKIKASEENSHSRDSFLHQCYASPEEKNITTSDKVEYISEKDSY